MASVWLRNWMTSCGVTSTELVLYKVSVFLTSNVFIRLKPAFQVSLYSSETTVIYLEITILIDVIDRWNFAFFVNTNGIITVYDFIDVVFPIYLWSLAKTMYLVGSRLVFDTWFQTDKKSHLFEISNPYTITGECSDCVDIHA